MDTAPLATASRHLALRVACAGLRVLFRHAPGRHGKRWLWERVVRPHILPHSFPIAARTRFGACTVVAVQEMLPHVGVQESFETKKAYYVG